MEKKWRDRKLYSLHKEAIGYFSPPGAERDFWHTMLSREQKGYQKSDPGEDQYYVGCLGQTLVLLPEQLISDHWHIMVRGYQPDTSKRKLPCMNE